MLSYINGGYRQDISIFELAQLIWRVTSFEDKITTDPSEPGGTVHLFMDVKLLRQSASNKV